MDNEQLKEEKIIKELTKAISDCRSKIAIITDNQDILFKKILKKYVLTVGFYEKEKPWETNSKGVKR